ncbi:MAG: N-acetyltransferase, partial [Pseudomonadota bacterium]
AFTQCAIEEVAGAVYLLGPLAVAPSLQRRGIGQLLIGEGHTRLAAVGATHVYVLGDPAYYAKSGFAAEQNVMPPYPLPPQWAGAWQSQPLSDGVPALSGTLNVPPVWDDPVLWQP